MESLEKWAETRETSLEIAQAIKEIAPENMNEVWENPASSKKSILKRAFEIANWTHEDELFWGEEKFPVILVNSIKKDYEIPNAIRANIMVGGSEFELFEFVNDDYLDRSSDNATLNGSNASLMTMLRNYDEDFITALIYGMIDERI